MMRRKVMLAGGLILALLGPGRADDTGESLEQIGRDFCRMSLDGTFTPFDASDFRAALAEAGGDEPAFCGCVGALYRSEGDGALLSDLQQEIIAGESYFSLNFTMFDHMNSCLPGEAVVLAGIDLGLSDADLAMNIEGEDPIDGDLAGTGLSADESDIFMCTSALSGDMPLPGFNSERLLERLSRHGQEAGDVCTCAAYQIAERGPEFQAQLEKSDEPTRDYGWALITAVDNCLAE